MIIQINKEIKMNCEQNKTTKQNNKNKKHNNHTKTKTVHTGRGEEIPEFCSGSLPLFSSSVIKR